MLTHAEDWRQPVTQSSSEFAVYQLVILMEQIAALGMANEHVRDSMFFKRGADTSPVNGPLSSQYMFCPARPMHDLAIS